MVIESFVYVHMNDTPGATCPNQLCAYDPMTSNMENLLDGGGLVSNSDMVLRHAAPYVESLACPGQPLTILYLFCFKTSEPQSGHLTF
jgi:hypothetical protein